MKFIKRIFSFICNLWVWWFDSEARKEPKKLGKGPHDCALVALYAAVPGISEDDIIDAFTCCAGNWPYEGVTNREFNIAVRYLKLKVEYDDSDGQTVNSLTQKKTDKCVALLHGHYVAMKKGKIIGKDTNIYNNSKTKVYCSWRFIY